VQANRAADAQRAADPVVLNKTLCVVGRRYDQVRPEPRHGELALGIMFRQPFQRRRCHQVNNAQVEKGAAQHRFIGDFFRLTLVVQVGVKLLQNRLAGCLALQGHGAALLLGQHRVDINLRAEDFLTLREANPHRRQRISRFRLRGEGGAQREHLRPAARVLGADHTAISGIDQGIRAIAQQSLRSNRDRGQVFPLHRLDRIAPNSCDESDPRCCGHHRLAE
jgi:hypothetical protein